MPHSVQLPGYAPVALRYAGGYAAKEELTSRGMRERIWENIFYGMKLCEFLRIGVFFLLVIGPSICDRGYIIYLILFVAVAMFLHHPFAATLAGGGGSCIGSCGANAGSTNRRFRTSDIFVFCLFSFLLITACTGTFR